MQFLPYTQLPMSQACTVNGQRVWNCKCSIPMSYKAMNEESRRKLQEKVKISDKYFEYRDDFMEMLTEF